MAKKRDENAFNNPPAADVVKPSELVSGNIPPATDPAPTAENAPPPGPEKAAENNPPENPQPVETSKQPVEPALPGNNAPTPDAGGTQAAQIVTASQLVTENIPQTQLPPAPGQPKRGKGRPAIPHPECKKCGRKHATGPCPNKSAASVSSVVIPEGSPQPEGEGAEGATEPTEEKSVNHRQLAEMAFDLTTNSAAAFIGPEWRPNDPQEREGVLIPLEMYFKTQKMDDIPPGAILCFALASYAAPRFRAPATSSKIKLGWAWIKSKWAGRKQRGFVPQVVQKTPVNGDNPFSEKN